MTEKGYEGDQSSSSWDIPGPSSLAAILDTVYTSSASDNPPRNEEMECEALFAESDDEVEVLPTPSEATSAAAVEDTSKPVSSNYVNSTTPIQAYELNMTSVAPPGSAHTPVPEEYQPLPDSSSSLDYALGRNNLESGNLNGQRFPDVNIRYQPKPISQRGYYYPNYQHYGTGVRPGLEYVFAPYHANNVIVLSDDRSYVPHPVAYTLPQGEDNSSSTAMDYDPVQPRAVQNNHISATGRNHLRSNQPHALERPSRKLNISPRRRQSKESEGTNTNLIEVSSEEEDNISIPRKKQCDNGAGHQANSSSADPVAGGNCSHANPTPARVSIKREPHDHSEATMQAAGEANTDGNTGAPEHHNCSRRHGHHNNHRPHHNCYANTHIKQENFSCNCVNRTSCGCRTNHGSTYAHSHSIVSECQRHSPNHVHHQNGSHHHHHHHHHRTYRQCSQHNVGGTSNALLSQVKEEPGTQGTSIKQEPDPPPAQNSEESISIPVSAGIVKIEATDQARVKVEPGTSNDQSNESAESVQNVTVKSEREDGRCCDVNAGGDRRAKEKSPQPGTSLGRTTQTEARTSSNCDQEVQTNPVPTTGVLSAPDLQLDWVSDSSSDDDVQVLGEDTNPRAVIDLTASPDRSLYEYSSGPLGNERAPHLRSFFCPADSPPYMPQQPPHAHLVRRGRGNCLVSCRGCCCTHPQHGAAHAGAGAGGVYAAAPAPHAHAPPVYHMYHTPAPPAHMGERRRDVMSIAPPYIVHERLWHRQHHMLELQRRSAMGDMSGGLHFPPTYPVPPPAATTFPEEFEPRDLRSNRGNQGIGGGAAPAPSGPFLDGQHVHHHMHHYLQMHPPHLHISIQPSVLVRPCCL
ncbi:hypothetical protein ABMA27_007984 [Loxostege sticticalis]|uniref:Uncharacterized protein n=1 Tax=Loxostege sticticalis TaxID=481309 RepID=A0ABR3HDK7_LOXSC